MRLNRGGLASEVFFFRSNNELQEVSRTHSSVEVSVMEMERRGEQSISFSRSRLVIEATPVDNVKGGKDEREREERTHGHK